jgi:hypothetical protein
MQKSSAITYNTCSGVVIDVAKYDVSNLYIRHRENQKLRQ